MGWSRWRVRAPRIEAEVPAIWKEHPDFSSLLSHLKITWESALWFNYLFFSILFLFYTCSNFLPPDLTGFVSSTALCCLFCPRACCKRCGSSETTGMSEKMWLMSLGHQWAVIWVLCSQNKACFLWCLRETSPSRLMVTDGMLALWAKGWRRRIYVRGMLLQAISISLSHILPRCTQLQPMFPRFWLVKKSRKDMKLSFCGDYLSFWVLSRI